MVSPIARDLAQGVFCMCHSTKIRGKHGLEMELAPLAQDQQFFVFHPPQSLAYWYWVTACTSDLLCARAHE